MESYNIHRAKTHFSRLVDRVEGGEEILIARDGVAVARLVAEKKPLRKPGRLKGRIVIKKGFDDPLPRDVLSAFNGDKP
jgi:antitoxin (DNA-binding transcriptional repressor) of toxin-antitoxin stability system